eukprot:gene11968-5369_t
MKTTFSPNELEYFAEDEMIEILPKISMDEVNLIQGSFGPFEANVPLKVPIWIACTLRKKGICKLLQPEWLTIDHLQEILTQEKEEKNQQDFLSLPFYFLEMALILLKVANTNGSDFEKSENLKVLLEDIISIREQKILNGINSLDRPTAALDMTNVTASEINKYREGLTSALDILDEMKN